MHTIDFEAVDELLRAVRTDGRERLFEHECYELLARAGIPGVPATVFLPPGAAPSPGDLDALPTDRVVLKIVSPDIVHKTDVGGVRVVARRPAEVAEAALRMLEEVPAAHAGFLEHHGGPLPEALAGLEGGALVEAVRSRIAGVLVCSFVAADDAGFAGELFVGLRDTAEFGPVLSAGLGGTEMELLARVAYPGTAVAIAPTGLVDGEAFLEVFRSTLSYRRLAGKLRAGSRLVDDRTLADLFQAFIDLGNRYAGAADRGVRIAELEVNPFVIAGGRPVALDGACTLGEPRRRSAPRPVEKIGRLLRPRSAAVIGVSASSMNMGRIILRNMVAAGFPSERLTVIRPGTDEIDGIRCVGAIAELPEKVDLLVVAVNAAQVPAIVTETIEHDRAEAVILIPGGLGEKEGSQEVARSLHEAIARAHGRPGGGPVFLGGNSLGVISHPGRYDTMFIPESKLPKSRGDHPRRTAFVSQSGAFIIANLSRMPWLDPAFALSIGNQIDLTAADLLAHLADEPGIEVIAAYMEGFQPGDGLRFARAVRRAVAHGKDVVFYKAGRTAEGRSATAGHTASVAGDYAVCEAALNEAGALVARTFDEFSDLLQLAVRLAGKRVRGDRLAAMSNAGFESVGMADSIHHPGAHLTLAAFSPATAARLEELLARHRLQGLVDVKNPFDVTPMATDEAFAELAGALLADEGVDAAVVGVVPLTPAMQTLPPGPGHTEDVGAPAAVAARLVELAAAQDKPLVAVVDSGALFDPLAGTLAEGGLPVFRAADRAVRALARWIAVTRRNQDRRQGAR